MYKWPVARAIPAELFKSLPALKFVKEEIILPFGSPKFILSDNDLKFDCKAIEDFVRDQKIQWKHIATHSPRGNGMAERMIGTIKRTLQKMCRANMSDWVLCFDEVLIGYRRRSSTDGKFPFEVLYDVKSRFSEENEASTPLSTEESKEFELAIALAACAERVVPRMMTEEQIFKTGYWEFLRRGNQ